MQTLDDVGWHLNSLDPVLVLDIVQFERQGRRQLKHLFSATTTAWYTLYSAETYRHRSQLLVYGTINQSSRAGRREA